MTARAQLPPHRSRASSRGGRAPLMRRHLAAALSTTCEVGDSASDALCRAPRVPPLSGKVASERQDRFRRSLVNESSFRSPGRLPSKSASGSPLSRTVRRPATDLAALPPSSRLPTRFYRATFSRGPARPAVELASSSLASAEGRTPLFDFCNRNDDLRARLPIVRTPGTAVESPPKAAPVPGSPMTLEN